MAMNITVDDLIAFVTCPCMDDAPHEPRHAGPLWCQESMRFTRPLTVPAACDACLTMFRATARIRSAAATKSSGE